MKYVVRNVAGGVTRFSNLDAAMKAASKYMNEPYVETISGKRPVVDTDEGLILGKYNESHGDASERLRNW